MLCLADHKNENPYRKRKSLIKPDAISTQLSVFALIAENTAKIGSLWNIEYSQQYYTFKLITKIKKLTCQLELNTFL